MDKGKQELAQHQADIDLVHAILLAHAEPLTANEILAAAVADGAQPSETLQASIAQVLAKSSMVMPLADGHYAWLPRLMTGSVVRVPLYPKELVDGYFAVSEEFENALWPSRPDATWFTVTGPVRVHFPDEDWVELDFLDEGPGELNDWLRLERPKPGDSLIVTVTDGLAGQATIRLERRAERDQAAVEARNAELRAAAEAWLQATGDRFLYNLSTAMLVQGVFKTSPPPDPLVMVLDGHPNWDKIYAKRYEKDIPDTYLAALAGNIDPDDEVPDEDWDNDLDDTWDEDEDDDDAAFIDLGEPIALTSLPLSNRAWTFGALRYPHPIRLDSGELVAAHMVMVIDDQSGRMLYGEVHPGPLEPGDGRRYLDALMRTWPPEQGGPHRPSRVYYNSAKLLSADDRQALFELGIDSKRVNLDHLQKDLANFLAPPEPPGVLSGEGVTPEAVGAVMAAAVDFYRAEPWVALDNDDVMVIQIDGGPKRIAQVMGSGGVEYGLVLMQDWAAHLAIQLRAHDNDPQRALKPASVMRFAPEVGLPPDDRQAFKTYPWPVTDAPDGQGHPLVTVAAPGNAGASRPPNASELRELHAALLAVAGISRTRIPPTGQLAGVSVDETLSLTLFTGPARVRVRFPAGVIDRGQLASYARPTNDHMVMMEPTMWDLATRGGSNLKPDGVKAQKLVYEARESDNPAQRLALAHQALSTSADCADAYVFLAEEEADTRTRARELFAQGVAAGERALGAEFFARERGNFWGLIETRPYMRARHGLALVLWELGEHQAALDHFLALLQLNPGDNQGVRYLAAVLMLELRQTEALVALIAEHAVDESAAWQYLGVLAYFRREGDSLEARQRLARARQANPHVIDLLLQRQRLDANPPDSIALGDRSEAHTHAHDVLSHWRRTPGALAWLKSQSG